MSNCLCSVHLKVDQDLEKEGHVRLKCTGHGEGCPCSDTQDVVVKEEGNNYK